MTIFITGSTGSGKTDASWALLEATKNMTFLDCDWFASREPFSWSQFEDVKAVFEAIKNQTAFHCSQGRSNFVITLTVEMAECFEQLGHFLHDSEGIHHHFRLVCSPSILTARIEARDRPQKLTEIKHAEQITARLDSCFGAKSVFFHLETSDLTPSQVASAILQKIKDQQDGCTKRQACDLRH